jgi:hypothetical protein
MPNLGMSVQRTTSRAMSTGSVIKGIYYSRVTVGRYDAPAFYFACDQHLEPLPFLVADFNLGQLSLDPDRDGCADVSGSFRRTSTLRTFHHRPEMLMRSVMANLSLPITGESGLSLDKCPRGLSHTCSLEGSSK